MPDLVELRGLLARREVSAAETLDRAFARLDEVESELSCFVHLADREALRSEAVEIDRRRVRGAEVGVLGGVPIAVKDAEDVRGMPTTHGSWLAGHDAAARDSRHVARLRAAGTLIVGKTNLPEFGYSIHTRNRRFGETRNPADPARSVGGSSGGSAAAVAADIVALATGGDGGGSIRIPAAFCGLPALKPTFGRVPLESDSWGQLSHVGALTRSLRDIALYLDVAAGPAPEDRFSLPAPDQPFQAALREPLPLAGTRVAVGTALGGASADDEAAHAFRDALETLATAGMEISDANAETDARRAFLDLASYADGAAWRRVPDEERARATRGYAAWCERGLGVTVDDLVAAEQARNALNAEIEALLADAGAILTPTVGLVPWRLDEPPDFDPVDRLLTFPLNMTGHPALTVPLPGTLVGLQLIGPRFAEGMLLRLGQAISEALR